MNISINKNHILFFFFLLFFASFSFAETTDEVGFFEEFSQTVKDIYNTVAYLPEFVNDLLASLVEYYVYWQISTEVFFLNVSYGIALKLVENLNVTTMINQAFSNIPPNIGHYLNLLEVGNCVSFLLECLSTSLVFNMIRGR